MSKRKEPDVSENPLYHDTWTLLRKYRDVVWSLELSVQKVRRQFQIEFGSSIEDFLESIYIAGLDFENTDIAEQTKSIERSHKMLKLVEHSVNLLREKHKNGEEAPGVAVFHRCLQGLGIKVPRKGSEAILLHAAIHCICAKAQGRF